MVENASESNGKKGEMSKEKGFFFIYIQWGHYKQLRNALALSATYTAFQAGLLRAACCSEGLSSSLSHSDFL